VDLPASVPLSGSSVVFRLRPDQPVMLHLRAAAGAPVATRLERTGGPPEVEVFPTGALLDAFLPPGSATLTLRALAGATLSGRAELTTTPVTQVGEGLGPEVLLPPGATRLFSFRVQRPGPIGVGVRSSEDVVEATLMSSDGRRLGSGVAQMPTLEPGTYLLSLHAPREGRPVRARPAVVGLTPPDTGPPEEVVRQYLESYGREGAGSRSEGSQGGES
jgi:hypothetical protein